MGRNIKDLKPDKSGFDGVSPAVHRRLYVWTSTFVQLAVAVMLYRVRVDTIIRCNGLLGIMVLIVELAVASCLWDYWQCRPIPASWDQFYSEDYCSLSAFP